MKEETNIATYKLILIGIVIWAMFSLLETLSAGLYWISEHKPAHWLHLFWYKYTNGIIWCLFLPFLLQIVQRLPFDRFNWQKLLAWHSLAALFITPIHRFLTASLNHFIQTQFDLFTRPYGWWEYVSNNFIGNALKGITTYAVLVSILYAYFLYWRNIKTRLERSQLAADLSKAKLKNLESQLQPHFLFNTMQSISALMHKDVEQADTAMGELSDLLRISFKRGEKAKVVLREELMFCEKYIALQQMRFQEHLEIQLHCLAALKEALVPTMILQPFLENSIKHGFEPFGGKGWIQVNIWKEQETLHIEILDNGQQQVRTIIAGTGFENTLSRLKFLYEDRFIFNYERKEEAGFQVRIEIPLEK